MRSLDDSSQPVATHSAESVTSDFLANSSVLIEPNPGLDSDSSTASPDQRRPNFRRFADAAIVVFGTACLLLCIGIVGSYKFGSFYAIFAALNGEAYYVAQKHAQITATPSDEI